MGRLDKIMSNILNVTEKNIEIDSEIAALCDDALEYGSVLGHTPTFHVTTFGCQMNARDSEKLRGTLLSAGFLESDDEECDVVIYNTCTVRENANLKVYGRLGVLNGFKKKNPNMKIVLCGCMMQEEDEAEKIRKSYPFVDLIFGTHNVNNFPVLMHRVLNGEKHVKEILEENNVLNEGLPVERKYSFKEGINIMYGCDNFCSYCIVPYVRGREISREPKDILREIETLVKDGVIEIMLLGQNVNSYGKKFPEGSLIKGGEMNFVDLLREIEKIDGLKRIRFMTSHPKDLSDELIDEIASSEKICHHIHLPLQSGSTKVLSEMNRHYTKESYLSLAQKIREKIPDISLTTDIMVGFPGETEEDFLDTMDVVEKVRFDSAFTFIYSMRTGTPAAKRDDQVPEDIVKERFSRLLNRVQEIGTEQTKKLEGRTMPVLVEEKNEREENLLTGRLSNNAVVHLHGGDELIGKIVSVRLDKAMNFYYFGEIAE